MNSTKAFQETIKAELDRRAGADPLFAKSYAKENKSIEECCKYIIGEVKAMNVEGLTDDEVYGLAMHYYDEDNITVQDVRCDVRVNHHVELSEEEKAEAKLAAMKRFEQDEYRRLQEECKSKTKAPAKPKVEKHSQPTIASPSLFDMLGDETQE